MLKLLIGTDWIANRNAILMKIEKDVTQEKGGRILIVPELISHDTERRLCAIAGDSTSRFAEVLSFTRFARRVADAEGHAAVNCTDNGGRVVAMASAVRQLHSRLKAYASVETKPEFLTALVDAIDEFKRCCISAEDLKKASTQTQGSLAQKLEELALILESYDAICRNGKCDPRDQMTWLLEQLEDSDFAKEHVFYIDGFPDFTRQHTAILEHLICHATEVTVGLNCDCVGSELLAFEKAGETARQLQNIANKHGIECRLEIIPGRDDCLKVIRERLFQGNTDVRLEHQQLRLYRTGSVYQEISAAAKCVLDLVRSGYRYRDIGIVCGDMDTYKTTLETVLTRCHIPAYIAGTDQILDKTVITTVLAALDTALGGFEKQDVMRYLKSPLSPLSLSACDRMESYAILWAIDGSRWTADWQYHPGGLGAEWTETAKDKLQKLNDDRKTALEPLIHLRDGFKNAGRLAEQIQALYNFFEEIGLRKRLENMAVAFDQDGDNRSAQILNQLWEILVGALEQLYDVLGASVWDEETFARLFKLLLSQYDVGTIPTVLDSVMIGPVSAMRCQQVKHLIVIGATEGILPGYAGATGILTDQERIALRMMGVPLTGGAMEGVQTEFAEIYGVFCGAEESVTVSCPSGQPSMIYRRLAEMVEDEYMPAYELAAPSADEMEAGAYLARLHAEESAKDIGVTAAYQMVSDAADYDVREISAEGVRQLYGDRVELSASQVDKLADCRYHYFLRYGLRVRELKPATVDPAEFGTYVHDVLEHTAREVCERGGFHCVSENETMEIAKKYSDAYIASHFSQIDAERTNYLFNRNKAELELIVKELWDELRSVQFAPVGFEVSFGKEGEYPPIDCSTDSLQAEMRGFIDRVDSWYDGEHRYFRVVDYKTGKKDLDYCDLINGIGLQMLIYLFALEQADSDLLGRDPISAGVQYFPARVPILSQQGQVSEEDVQKGREKSWERKGLLLMEERVLAAMESENALYRMPYKRRKDGSIDGDVAGKNEFTMLKKYVFGLLHRMVDDIASGNVKPNPYTRGSRHDACTYCPYGIVCHKTTVDGRRSYTAISAQEFWDDIKKAVNGHG